MRDVCADLVERAARAEPLELLGGDGVVRLDAVGGAVGVGEDQRGRAAGGHGSDALDSDHVIATDLVVEILRISGL